MIRNASAGYTNTDAPFLVPDIEICDAMLSYSCGLVGQNPMVNFRPLTSFHSYHS